REGRSYPLGRGGRLAAGFGVLGTGAGAEPLDLLDRRVVRERRGRRIVAGGLPPRRRRTAEAGRARAAPVDCVERQRRARGALSGELGPPLAALPQGPGVVPLQQAGELMPDALVASSGAPTRRRVAEAQGRGRIEPGIPQDEEPLKDPAR